MPHDATLSSSTCAAPAGWYGTEWSAQSPKTGWYFFYGTLMDPSKLTEVITGSGETRLKLQPAWIVGYKTMLWGPYPVLIDGESNAVIRGAAFRIETSTQARRLQGYETDAYTPKPCRIHLEGEGGEENAVDGLTFMWNRSQGELKEGRFDLQEFRLDNLEQSMT